MIKFLASSLLSAVALGAFWLGAAVTVLPPNARAGQPMQIQDVIEVDGAHVRRIYDPAMGVACYVMRWPAGAAPDLACVKVGAP
jgi:hypothetical protein